MKFSNCIGKLFESEIQREEREAAELEAKRQRRLQRQQKATIAAALLDGVKQAKALHKSKCLSLDNVAGDDPKRLYAAFEGDPATYENAMNRILQIEGAKRHVEGIKAHLHRVIVERAEAQLSEFESKNAADLKGLKFEETEAEPFVPAKLPADHYVSGAATELHRASIMPG